MKRNLLKSMPEIASSVGLVVLFTTSVIGCFMTSRQSLKSMLSSECNSTALRLNQIQVVGSHNSYHREISLAERPFFEKYVENYPDYYYSLASVNDQLEYQQVRSFEFDLHIDTEGGLYSNPLIRQYSDMTNYEQYKLPESMKKPGMKVLHVPDLDVGTMCHTLIECLQQVKKWSSEHKNHVPIPILLEFKSTEKKMEENGGVKAEKWTTAHLDAVDAEIRSVFTSHELIVPDDIRQDDMTLEESVLSNGWPTLASSLGKVFFVMDNDANNKIPVRDPYRAGGRQNLEGRVIFTNSYPGQADCAFIKRNEPEGKNLAEIQALVKAGYFIRTRADEPIYHASHDIRGRSEAAFESGAQIVSTDWPAPGMATRYNTDYHVSFPKGLNARCNPINSPFGCIDKDIENL